MRWKDQTVVCIASGPSLAESDCLRVEKSGLPVVAVNTAWKSARFADVIYAADYVWWKHYGEEIDIPAQRWTCSENCAKTYGINRHGYFVDSLNSGLRAIQFAVSEGASRIILLGFDCSLRMGTHCHGDHVKTPNPTEKTVREWLRQFEHAATELSEVEVVNCSRDSELTCFPRGNLEDALC